MPVSKTLLSSLLCIATLHSQSAMADALTDLKTTLHALNGKDAISAHYQIQFLDVSDANDEDDRRETSGKVRVKLNESEQGLQLSYSKAVMDQVETESMQKVLNEEAKTPTLNAIRGINATSVRNVLSASANLQRTIAKATLLSEETQNFEGKPATLLTFELPLDAIINDKKTREYVSKFEGKYTILIDENGVPLESRTEFSGKGRAFIVLSVKAKTENYSQYRVIGNRLVRVKNAFSREFSSTFGDNLETGESVLIFEDTSFALNDINPSTELSSALPVYSDN